MIRLVMAAALFAWHAVAVAQPPASPAAIVREVLSQPDERLDYARAQLAFDRIIDPSLAADAVLSEIERLARSANALVGAGASPTAKLSALRRVIYESGAWNGRRPFAYDQADPLHVFIRHADASGREINLETTSGGWPTRPIWYRQNRPMSDRSIESGLYMRTLSRREGVALMASTMLEFLMEEGRFQEAIELAEVILQYHPRDGLTMVKLGTAYGELMRIEFVERFPIPGMIPPPLRMRYAMLAQQNQRAFEAAEALGWEPVE